MWVPRPLDEVFNFFSDAHNLEKITPTALGFRILNEEPIVMKCGLRIDYQIRLHGIPMKWSSEITEWDPPHHFSDTQIRGPYQQWHHRHSFKTSDNGTIVTDDVQYAVPLSWVPGMSLIEHFFIQPELRRIFLHRARALECHFQAGSQTPLA